MFQWPSQAAFSRQRPRHALAESDRKTKQLHLSKLTTYVRQTLAWVGCCPLRLTSEVSKMRRGVHALLSRRCRADTGLFQRAPVSPSSSARLHTHLDARHAANATDIPAFYTLRFGRRATRSSARCVAIPISLVHGMNWTTHRRSNATPAQSGSIAPSCQRNEAQLVLATKQPLQLVGWRKRWRARWRILVRLSELFIFVTPLAATATVLYCLRLVGLRS